MSGSTPVDLSNTADSSDTGESLASFHTCLIKFTDSHEFPLSNVEVENKISEIKDWVEKQKESSDEKANRELVQNMGKFDTSTANGIQKMEGGDALGGTLEMVSAYLVFVSEMVGDPIGAAVGAITGTICSIIGAIFAASKPQQLSFIEQVAEVVHKELVEFNSKLQGQKYFGLYRRVSDQTAQLQKMKRGEKLNDDNLWNDYVQFMGELGNRIQSPLPCNNQLYKLSDHLTDDREVADFVTALMTYCTAFGCFCSLLIQAKGTFARLGKEYKKDEEKADRKITSQRKDLKEKLSFLFDDRYLKFLGRLPSEGGKLIKIVAFSRNAEARRIVKMTTSGFCFPEILDYEAVESKAEIVSRQSVKLKLKGHPNIFAFGHLGMQFINETQCPMKVVGYYNSEDLKEFSAILRPRSSLGRWMSRCSRGYVLIYLDGQIHRDDEPYTPDETRIIEFASHEGSFSRGINIQDKTFSEFTKGQDTLDKCNGSKKNIYWKTKGVHYMASAEYQIRYYVCGHPVAGPTIHRRFVFQDFDPFCPGDIDTWPKGEVYNDT